MHSITVGEVEVSFESALISVPRDGSDHDWLCNDWVDVRQTIDVIQADGWATVTGLTGIAPEKGTHVVRLLAPTAYTEHEVVDYFVRSATTSNVSREAIVEAVEINGHSWGRLISLNWSVLGYAPGGIEYCILPTNGCAITLGHLRLKWATVEIRAKAQLGG